MTAGLDPDEGLAEQGYERHPDHLRMLARLGRWVERGLEPPVPRASDEDGLRTPSMTARGEFV